FRSASLEVIEAPVNRVEGIESALRQARDRGAHAVVVPQDGLFNANLARIARAATGYRLASIGEFCLLVEGGGLASYGADPTEIMRQTADYVDRILKGARPSDLPFLQADTYDLCLNRK